MDKERYMQIMILKNGEMETSVFLRFIKLTQEAREKETEKLGV